MSDQAPNAYQAGGGGSQTAAAPPPASPWIMSAGLDLLLFVATPVLILPLFLFAKSQYSMNDIALYVVAFGALGHHLPGMLRAYGDTALFREYKVRFIVAPIFLFLVCVWCTLYGYAGITFIAYSWGLWHGLMQTYGFVRIYDAKVKSFAKITQRLDFQMCLWWFLCGVFLSPSRFYMMIEVWSVKCGGPLPSAAVLDGIQYGVAGITGAVTIAFLVNHARLMREGRAPSPIKLLLMGISFAFWLTANIAFTNILVGVVLFEVFHDIQYLAIVWVFNRARVEKDPKVGAFTKFVFRRSGALIGIYIGMVFAYGSLRLVERGVPNQFTKDALTGVLAASALLHFYYDGFIWKIRQKKTSDALGVGGGEAKSGGFGALHAWAKHGAKWALFVIPLAFLIITESSARANAGGGGAASFKALQALEEKMPDNAFVHQELGNAYRQIAIEQDNPEHRQTAIRHYERAADLGIGTAENFYHLGTLLAETRDFDGSLVAFDRAVDLEPANANVVARRGRTLLGLDRPADATAAFDRALDLDGANAIARHGLGAAARDAGDTEAAIKAFREAADYFQSIREDREEPELAQQFGLRIYERGRDRGKNAEYELEEARTRHELAELLAAGGDFDGAIVAYKRAVEVRPTAVGSWFNLGATYARVARLDEAVAAFREVLKRQPGNASAKQAIEMIEAKKAG